MFEQAARLKLRFETSQGIWSVEELWEAPLTHTKRVSLNDIAISLHNQLKHDTVSFVEEEERPDARLQLSFDIVKHIIGVRKAEMKTLADARAKSEQKQKLLAVLARREDNELESKSPDEIRAMIEAL